MAPPLYADLGKSGRDLLSKGYNFGFVKFESTTKSGNIEFKSVGDHNLTSSKFYGGLDLTYKVPEHGITLTEKLNNEGTLSTQCIFDKFAKGLKVYLDSAFAPAVGKRAGKVKGEYKLDCLAVNAEINVDNTGGPFVHGGVVYAYKQFLVGYFATFDYPRRLLSRNNMAIGFVTDDFTIHTFINDNKEFGGNVHHKVSEDVELAASVGWTTGEQATRFALGSKYKLDKNTFLKAKVSSTSMVAFSLTHALKPGFKATVSTQLSLGALNDGNHKIGFGLEYDPSGCT